MRSTQLFRPTALVAIVATLVLATCSNDQILDPDHLSGPMAAIGVDPMSGATIETDRDDYLPGEIVHLVGRGWAPNETVRLFMTEEPDTHNDITVEVQADAEGGFALHFYDVQPHDFGVTFTLNGTGLTSGSSAVAVFTDGRIIRSVTINGAFPGTTLGASPNQGLFVSIGGETVMAGGNARWMSTRVAFIPSPTGTPESRCDETNVQPNNTATPNLHLGLSTTAPAAPGTYKITITAFQDDGCVTQPSAPFPGPTDPQFTLVVSSPNAAPVLAPVGSKTVPELTSLAFTATATDENVSSLVFTLANPASGTFPAGATITGAGAFAWTPTEAQGPGVYRVKVVVRDNGAETDTEEIEITVSEVNLAPELAPIGSQTVDEGSELSFNATATDPDLPANSLSFTLDPGASAGAAITPAGAFTWTPTEAQGPGSYPITVRVTDNGISALSDTETITVTVNEVNKPPVLGLIGNKVIDEGSLLTFTATATDPDLPANTVGFSLDAGAPAGASITPAGVFTWTPPNGPASVSITVRVTDNGSPALSDFETITVTVNNVPPVITALNIPVGPIAVGNPVTVTWGFTDPGIETWACQISWDTGLPFEPATYAPVKNCSATKALAAGVYTVTIRVSDGAGADTETATAYIVVYDPNGTVTGGGWSSSPPGAYVLNPAHAGKATFGFGSKYQKGRIVPDGNTEFQLHGAMAFKSTSYEWLVVAGSKAQYKGEGTIQNMSGVYGFLLTATDGSPGKFRIKIWNKATNALVYDNQMGAAEDSNAATAAGGGSIVTHNK